MTTVSSLVTERPAEAGLPRAALKIDTPSTPVGAVSRSSSRRALLVSGASVALAAAGVARRARADAADPRENWVSLPKRLVRRVTHGLTAAEGARAEALGFHAYLEAQLNPAAIGDAATENWVAANCPLLSQPASALRTGRNWDAYIQLANATLYRAVFSSRQLQERMVELWTDHFNMDFRKVGLFKLMDDREVIRPHALGSFPAMLRASAHSPAMLMYLDNAISHRTAPNLNYGRELLELHTLGVGGGYTEEDVHEVSRCFTGWTVNMSPTGSWGSFLFNPQLHDNGAKRVLGVDIPAGGGIRDGEIVLEILLQHPSTAQRVARKVVTWLLDESAPSGPVNAAAAAFRQTGGDIPSMIRAVLTPEYLAAAPAKLKRPFHLLVSAVRAGGMGAMTLEGLRSQLVQMGQAPYEWSPPDGYPDTATYWSGLMTARWNTATWLSYATNGMLPGLNSLTSAQAVGDTLDLALFAGEMPAAEKAELIAYLRPASPTVTSIREALGLSLASPGFQWY